MIRKGSRHTHLLKVLLDVIGAANCSKEKKDRLKSCILLENHKRSFVPTDYFSAIIKYKKIMYV
jgi:hypothetical protein